MTTTNIMKFKVSYLAYTESEVVAQTAGNYNWNEPKEKEIEYVTAGTESEAIEIVKCAIENNIRTQEINRKTAQQANTEQKLFFQFNKMCTVRTEDGINVVLHPGTRDEKVINSYVDFKVEEC